jgi:hypothetical protein
MRMAGALRRADSPTRRPPTVVLRDVYEWVDLSLFSYGQVEPEAKPHEVLSWLLADEHNYVNRYEVADNHPTDVSRMQEWEMDKAALPD